MKRDNTLKAATWYTISNFISKCLFYIFTPIYVKLLTVGEYGIYNNFLSWYAILVAVCSLDLSSTISTGFIDYKSETDFQEFMSSIAICSVLFPLVCSLIMFFFKGKFVKVFDLNNDLFSMLLLYLSFGQAFELFQTEQRNRVRYKLSSIATLIVAFGSCICSLLFIIYFKNKVNAIVIGTILFPILSSCFVLIFFMKRRFVVKLKYIKYALILAVPLIPHVVAGTVLGSSDKIMILKMCGEEQNAKYSLVFTISMVITLLASSINKAWIPWFFARLADKDYSTVQTVVKKILPLVGFLCLGVCLFAPEITLIMGKSEYMEAVVLFPPLVLHSMYNYLYTLYVNIEFYNKKTFGISCVTIVVTVLNLILNYYAIGLWGYQAAAYTTLFSSILSFILHMLIVIKQKMVVVFNNKFIIFLAGIITIMCLLVLFLYSKNILRYLVMCVYIGVFCISATKNKKLLKLTFMKIFGKE